MPLGDPGRQSRRDLFELAGYEAQRVDRMAGGDGERVRAVGALALPDAAFAALGDGLTHVAQIGADDLADVSLLNQLAREVRASGSLRACKPTADTSERSAARFAIRSASARFAPSGHSHSTGLPAPSACMHQVMVFRDAHDDGDEIDVRMRDHGLEVVEGKRRTECLGRSVGGVPVGGTDRLEAILR